MLKNVNSRNHLTLWGGFQYYFCGDCKNKLATTCHYSGLILYENLALSASTKFEGISSMTNNISPPPFEFQSNPYGVLNPSIKKFPMGKLSSIFVSETSSTSILPLIWSDSISNLFLMEFIFKCANTSLSGLLVRNDFRNFLQSVALSASSDSSESHTSNCQIVYLNYLNYLNHLSNMPVDSFTMPLVKFWNTIKISNFAFPFSPRSNSIFPELVVHKYCLVVHTFFVWLQHGSASLNKNLS